MTEERLQKVMAEAGVASRRACETLILEGKVKVDGQVVTALGTKVDPEHSKIEVAGTLIGSRQKPIYIILFKPPGYITTASDPRGRRTVMDLLGELPSRVYPVGRLDYDTSGLLLLTNDGSLAHDLMHPSRGVNKTYRVVVQGIPPIEVIKRLRQGVRLEDGLTSPARVILLKEEKGNGLLEITIHEGRNRQVRRMMEAVGYSVLHLKRIAFGPLELGGMKPGEWRFLTQQEISHLKNINRTDERER